IEAMSQTLVKIENQYLIKQPVTWEQFKTLQSAFNDIGGVRLNYCEGVLEIVGIGRLHEKIVTMLVMLIGVYCGLKRIRCISTGAYTQQLSGSTEFQADLSYNFETEKEVSDLCVEVVVTSGSTKKLRKYQLLGVPEVWFWQDGKISIYLMKDGQYEQSLSSFWLPELDIEHLEQCLLMDSNLEPFLAFQEKYQDKE
ncbi:MAG: Uma2 family endonuclease, partial [Pseudanabaena sp.]